MRNTNIGRLYVCPSMMIHWFYFCVLSHKQWQFPLCFTGHTAGRSVVVFIWRRTDICSKKKIHRYWFCFFLLLQTSSCWKEHNKGTVYTVLSLYYICCKCPHTPCLAHHHSLSLNGQKWLQRHISKQVSHILCLDRILHIYSPTDTHIISREHAVALILAHHTQAKSLRL